MSAFLEVIISLAFIFGIFSVLVSAASELIMSMWAQRGRTLWHAIRGLLPGDDNNDVANAFLRHPLVQGMGAAEHDPRNSNAVGRMVLRAQTADTGNGTRAAFPSYLSPGVFADTIMHLLRSGDIRHGTVSRDADLPTLIADVKNDQLRQTLQTLHDSSMDSGVPFHLRLQGWFNDSMDRATGWYRRTSHIVLFLVGFVLAVWCNVDTIRIIATLASDPTLRKGLADRAAAFAQTEIDKTATMKPATMAGPSDNDQPPMAIPVQVTSQDELRYKMDQYNAAMSQLNGLGIPLGWGKREIAYVIALPFLAIPGWLLSALAASMGANFWFQALGNLVRLRVAGEKPTQQLQTAQVAAVASGSVSPAMLPQPPQVPPEGAGLHSEVMDHPEGENEQAG